MATSKSKHLIRGLFRRLEVYSMIKSNAIVTVTGIDSAEAIVESFPY